MSHHHATPRAFAQTSDKASKPAAAVINLTKCDAFTNSMLLHIARKKLYFTYLLTRIFSAENRGPYQCVYMIVQTGKSIKQPINQSITFNERQIFHRTWTHRWLKVTLIQSSPLSPITHGSSSSSSSPSSRSPLASSLTRSVFHSELKTWLFRKSFPP